MPCYSPLTAYKAKSKDSDKISLTFSRPQSWRGESLNLPCGQCVGCRLERSRQWAVRCMHEASLYPENSFLTLTYDNDHLPLNGTLVLEDFQNFMKRLRKSIAPKKVRFYHCGEYGENLGRPHYHALLFGHDFADREFFKGDGGNKVYTSDTLSKLWPHGYSVVGDVTFDSAAYVARYIMKKMTGEVAAAHYDGKKPEYTTMSRRPGIGKGWYEKFKSDVYPLDEVVVNGVKTRPPKFYDNLLAKEDRSLFEFLKLQRERDAIHYVSDTLTDGRIIRVLDSSPRRLMVKEEVKLAEISTLVRHKEI